MSIELHILKILKHREKFNNYYGIIPQKAIEKNTQIILRDFGAYFKEFDVPVINSTEFLSWFKAFRHPTFADEDMALLSTIIKKIDTDVSPEVEAGFTKRLLSTKTAYELTEVITKYTNGEDIDLRFEIDRLQTRYDEQLLKRVVHPEVTTPIEDLLKAEEEEKGFKFRLPCLNRSIKVIRPGDFFLVAARPDKGKTSFMCSELTYMAAQVDSLFPGENRTILWFNNEGPGDRIKLRAYQSALNATIEDLIKMAKTPGAIRTAYDKVIGGRSDVIKIMDIHGFWNHEVEEIIKASNPAMIIFDMVDNIRFGGETANGGQRTDQLLEAMYQWARLIGVKYDCAVGATSQLSADADGLMWPTLTMLKDSRTGKQGAVDVIITLGTVNDPLLENNIYVGATKNKRSRTGVGKSPQCAVRFDRDRGRLVEDL